MYLSPYCTRGEIRHDAYAGNHPLLESIPKPEIVGFAGEQWERELIQNDLRIARLRTERDRIEHYPIRGGFEAFPIGTCGLIIYRYVPIMCATCIRDIPVGSDAVCLCPPPMDITRDGRQAMDIGLAFNPNALTYGFSLGPYQTPPRQVAHEFWNLGASQSIIHEPLIPRILFPESPDTVVDGPFTRSQLDGFSANLEVFDLTQDE